jgi:hypothetical protein
MYDPNNPYDESSTDDKVPDTDVSELAEAFQNHNKECSGVKV